MEQTVYVNTEKNAGFYAFFCEKKLLCYALYTLDSYQYLLRKTYGTKTPFQETRIYYQTNINCRLMFRLGESHLLGFCIIKWFWSGIGLSRLMFTEYGMGTNCNNQIVDRRTDIVRHDVKNALIILKLETVYTHMLTNTVDLLKIKY